jgi:hypothetical protein
MSYGNRIVPTETPEESLSLQKLLHAWANQWAQERGATLAWVEYTQPGLTNRLVTCFGLRRSPLLRPDHCLRLRDYSAADLTVISEPPVAATHLVGQGWRVLIENSTRSDQSTTFSTTTTLSTEKTTSWSSDLTLGVELGIGMGLMAALGVTSTTQRSSSTTVVDTKEQRLEQTIIGRPGKKTSAGVQIEETRVRTRKDYRARLVGSVVVRCKQKVARAVGAVTTDLKKTTWVIPISDIFADLRRYDVIDTIPAEASALIRQAMVQMELDPINPEVRFLMRGEEIETKMENASIQIKEDPIPGFETLPTEGTDEAKPGEEGRTIIARTAVADVENTVAIRPLGAADYSPDRREDLTLAMRDARAGDRVILDSALANKPGAIAVVLPADVSRAQQEAMARLVTPYRDSATHSPPRPGRLEPLPSLDRR